MNEPTMETLVRRLDRVERENRRLKRAGVVALAVMGTVMLVAMGWSPPEVTAVVEGNRFVLKDTLGKVRAELGPTELLFDGGIGLSFYNSNGEMQGKLFADNDEVELLLPGKDGGLYLSPEDAEKGGVNIMLFKGSLRGNIKNLAFGGLRPTDGGVALVLLTERGKAIGQLALVSDGTPRLTLSDKAGKVIWSAPYNERGA